MRRRPGAHERGLADDELVDEDGSLRDREDVARETGDRDRGRDTVEVDRQEAERRGLVGGNGDTASADAPRQRSA